LQNVKENSRKKQKKKKNFARRLKAVPTQKLKAQKPIVTALHQQTTPRHQHSSVIMKNTLKALCLYCGSSPGDNAAYSDAAAAFGRTLAERNIELVYGGGSVGLMGVAADACLAAGGRVTGVIPRLLMEKEVGHKNLTTMHVVENMHERKALMTTLSDGFIALPGGYGTLDELFEALTWLQLGYHGKPVGLLNVAGFFDHLVAFLGHARDERFLRELHHDALSVDSDLDRLIAKMQQAEAPDTAKWLDRYKLAAVV
jgi:uncharacterized protein (TIGR00730 family)